MQNNNVPDAGSVLAWGIVALAICSCPVGAPVGKAKVGTIFTRIAFPISIVMQVFWVIYIIVVVIVLANRSTIISGLSSLY